VYGYILFPYIFIYIKFYYAYIKVYSINLLFNKHSVYKLGIISSNKNKAKAISAKLLVVNLKNYLDEKRGKTGRN